MSGTTANFFAPDGEFQSRVMLPFLVLYTKGMAVTEDAIVLSGARQETEVTAAPDAMFAFDRQTGALKNSFHPSEPSEKVSRNASYISGGPIEVNGDRVLLANAAPFRLFEYPVSGGEVRLIAEDPELVPAIADDFTYLSEYRTPEGHAVPCHTFEIARIPIRFESADDFCGGWHGAKSLTGDSNPATLSHLLL